MTEPKTTTAEELLASQEKWWGERYQAMQELVGWNGRDMRDQDTLIKTVLGMEEDITYLLRTVNALTKLLQERSPETLPNDSSPRNQETPDVK